MADMLKDTSSETMGAMRGDVAVAPEAPPAAPWPAFHMPAATPLDFNLNLLKPVSQTEPVVLGVPASLSRPVSLTVPVLIHLGQTELHAPFTGLANLMGPHDTLLAGAPSSRSDLFGRR